MKRLVFLILLVIGLSFLIGFLVSRSIVRQFPKQTAITTFEECVAAGNPVMESYPERCTANGVTFTKEIGNELDLSDLITIETPRPNQVVTSPLRVAGRARGNWFFEATAPVKLLDESGAVISENFIQAQGEWMTEEFVYFEGKLIFDPGESKTGTILFEKSNASGFPENAQELRMPVKF